MAPSLAFRFEIRGQSGRTVRIKIDYFGESVGLAAGEPVGKDEVAGVGDAVKPKLVTPFLTRCSKPAKTPPNTATSPMVAWFKVTGPIDSVK